MAGRAAGAMSVVNRQNDPWMSLPMPPNWEAKYDMAQRRYFYVDHVTKTTTWEDPRVKIWQQQQRTGTAQSSVRQDVSPNRSGSGYGQLSPAGSSQPHNSSGSGQLRSPSPTAQSRTVPSQPQQRRDASPASQPQQRTVPSGGQTNPAQNLRDAVAAAQRATSGSASAYSKQFELQHMQQQPRVISQQRATTPQRTSGTNQSRSSTPSRQTGPAQTPSKAQPTKQQINIMCEKLHVTFPNSSMAVIQMALESCSYDETRARVLLETMEKDERISTSARTAPSTSNSSSTQSASAAATSSVVSMSSSSTTTAATTTTTTATTSAVGSNQQQIAATGSGSTSSSVNAASTTVKDLLHDHSTSSRDYMSTNVQAASVDTGSRSKVSSTTSGSAVGRSRDRGGANTGASSSAASNRRHSADAGRTTTRKTLAKGPDASLAHGHNRQLLLLDYQSEVGPRAELRRGPNPDFHRGPSVACRNGPHVGLAVGPTGSVGTLVSF